MPCGSPEEGSREGEELSSHGERVVLQDQYAPVGRRSMTGIGQGPEHRRGLISTPSTMKVSCLGFLQVHLITSMEKVRRYNTHTHSG